MVAGVVRELGINLGDNLGNNHEDPEFLSKDLNVIRKAVARRNGQRAVWGWKMPHSSEYLPELAPELRNPHVIIVFRNLLAMAESQMKRSAANFQNAFQFSLNRLNQVASTVGLFECPVMLVDYEKATRKPSAFIDEVSSFLNISPDAEARERAERMVDPETGYRRLSAETWQHTLVKAEHFDFSGFRQVHVKRRDINIVRENGRLQRTADRAIIEFSGISSKKIVLTMVRDSDPTFVRVAVDVGKGYSANMADKVSLYRGGNAITIEAENIRGIHIYPQFDGVVSNTQLFTVWVPN